MGGGNLGVARGVTPPNLSSVTPTLLLFTFLSTQVATPLVTSRLPPGNLQVDRGGDLGVSLMHIGATALEPGIAASAGRPAAYTHGGPRGPLLKMVQKWAFARYKCLQLVKHTLTRANNDPK